MRPAYWIVTVLLGLLATVIYRGVTVWAGTSSMTTYGFIAMLLGAIAAIAVGVGLMALMFYSNRRGYDDAAHKDRRLPK